MALGLGDAISVDLKDCNSLRSAVRTVIAAAIAWEGSRPGAFQACAVLLHLAGAKLDRTLGIGALEHRSFSAARHSGGRSGCLYVGDVALHVTTSPNIPSRARQQAASRLFRTLLEEKNG